MKVIQYLMSGLLAATLCGSASAGFVINELDSDSINTPSTDFLEYVELKGNPGESANGLVLVFFNGGTVAGGTPVSYRAIDLSAAVADSNGYLVVGTTATTGGVEVSFPGNTLQNGEDAVALYTGTTGQFPNGTLITTTNLIDYVVYEAANQTSVNWSAFGNPTVYRENFNGIAAEFGITRIPEGTGPFYSAYPSPRSPAAAAPDYSVSTNLPFPRLNQATAVVPTTRTLTLQSNGIGGTTVTQIALSGSSSAQYSLFHVPTFPVILDERNESTTVGIQLLDPTPTANKTYTGAIDYTTDNPTTPSGSLNISTELVRATQTAAVDAVMVNEICYNPGSRDHNGDGNTTNQNDEFVELVNMTASPILIEGWEQRSTDGDDISTFHSYVFPAGATIPADGFVTIFSGGTPTGFTPGTTFVYGAARIRNTGAYVGIHDGTKLVNGAAYLDAGADSPDADGYDNAGVVSASGGSIGRRPDGSLTFVALTPTDSNTQNHPSPNATNNVLITAASDWSIYE